MICVGEDMARKELSTLLMGMHSVPKPMEKWFLSFLHIVKGSEEKNY